MKSHEMTRVAGLVSALVAALIVLSTSAIARNRVVKPKQQPVTVIAHLTLPGEPINQVFVQDCDEKQLLYVVWNSKNGFTVIDVTDPRHPNVVKAVAWPNEASAGKLMMVGSGIALAEARDSSAGITPSASQTETLNVLDLSDPADPQTIRIFSNVTSVLTDTTRNLVYITNIEGLWILRNNQTSGEVANQHPCSTSDASNDVASCR